MDLSRKRLCEARCFELLDDSDGWTSVVDTLRSGNYFVTSGEVLLCNWSIEGSGSNRTYTAEAEWTFPPEFAELVWSDGKTVDRKIIDLKVAPSSSHKFKAPFDAAGKKMGAIRRVGFGGKWRI